MLVFLTDFFIVVAVIWLSGLALLQTEVELLVLAGATPPFLLLYHMTLPVFVPVVILVLF